MFKSLVVAYTSYYKKHMTVLPNKEWTVKTLYSMYLKIFYIEKLTVLRHLSIPWLNVMSKNVKKDHFELRELQ